MGKQSMQCEVILGVDTHLDMHVGVIIDSHGKMLDVLSIETNGTGYQHLLKWPRQKNSWAVLGTGKVIPPRNSGVYK